MKLKALVAGLGLLALAACADAAESAQAPASSAPASSAVAPVEPVPGAAWDGARAMADVQHIVTLGARVPGQPGHAAAIAMIQAEFQSLGIPVRTQTFTASTPLGDKTYTNIIASFNPTASERVIAGTHYDSIIRAYADREMPNGYMPGANNSASGVALLLETARTLAASAQKPRVGVDFIFFDGEEGPVSLGGGDTNWRAVGSPYFVSHIHDFYPDALPTGGVIFDMVCYKDMRLPPERNSQRWAPTQQQAFWSVGHTVAPVIFDAGDTPIVINDDHDALSVAGIPSFLVIGFNYDPWYNTTQDTPDKCSAASLQAVGQTLTRYLYGL